MNQKTNSKPKQKRTKISQNDIPNISLKQALKIANGIWENFAGTGAAPHNIAMALDLSPTSGGWRNMCGASIAYGLTEGGYNAAQILLTDLGRRIVSPVEDGVEVKALREAVLKPRIPGEFFRQYDRAKFPRDDIAANILIEKGIPKDRASTLVGLLKENGNFVGFIKETKTGPFVSLDLELQDDCNEKASLGETDTNSGGTIGEDKLSSREENLPTNAEQNKLEQSIANDRVFVTHGKNNEILEQIKEVVELGGFKPIVSIQRETAAKPIPEKILDDMRSCAAAVIHVGSEGILTDANGDECPQINPNVLIEIGAAMALYKGRFILVVEEGVSLPSNLQGLYESRYTGGAIEFKAGMKILKALRGLKTSS